MTKETRAERGKARPVRSRWLVLLFAAILTFSMTAGFVWAEEEGTEGSGESQETVQQDEPSTDSGKEQSGSTDTEDAKSSDKDNKSTSDKVKEKKKELSKGKKAESAIDQDLEVLKATVAKAEIAVAQVEGQVEGIKTQLAELTKDADKNRAKLETSSDELDDRLRAIYKTGSMGMLDVILSSKNVTDLVDNVGLVKRIYENDKDIVLSLEKKQKKLDKEEEKLTDLKKQLEEKEAELKEKKSQLQASKSALKKRRKEVMAANAKLEAEIEHLEEEAAAMTETIKGFENGGTFSGKLSWPVNGSINCKYGPRICPFHGKEVHSGVDLSASYGQAVSAAADGTVIQAGSNAGYGNSVTIIHGGQISTLYAHNSKVCVYVGQKVKRGQKIAEAGSTGNSTGVHVHFEVRYNGQHTDPMPYLK